ncbi:MAG: fibronectin type III domain-containing protein, partial [Steroidobacteraceae bacterium]
MGFAALQLSGDLNVVVVGWNDSTRTVSSVTDTAGNAYSLAAGPTVQSGTATQAIYYARNISGAAAGANTVTVSFNGAAAYPDIRILEYSGLDATNPLDVTAAAMGSGTSSSSGAATTSSANDLIIGANLVQSITTGPGAGFTNRVITAPDGDIAEDRVVTTTGSYTASAATTSGQWIMQMAAFRRAGGTQTAAPTAPGNLAVTAVSSAQINLSWSASTETGGTIAQYLIERCQGAGCTSFAQIGTSAGTAFNDTGLAASTTYTYRVRAQDALNTIGPYSGTAAATTLAPVVPTAPSGLTATAAGSTQINLTWGVSTETGGTIAQYLIERCQGAGCTSFAQIGTSAGTAFNDAGLTGSTSYSYRVRAKDAVNNTGPYSSVASVSTAAPVLTA